ncbi:MAG: thioredoxin family protein [Elusimicrobiota bacterium]
MAISLILFKSKSCSLCGQVESIHKSIVGLYCGKIKSEIIDITDNSQKAVDNGVMNIPTIIFFNDDKEIMRFSGSISKEKIEQAIKKWII